jgi:hypothetical protein
MSRLSSRHALALAIAVSTTVGLVVACGGNKEDPKTASSSSGGASSSSGGASSSGDPGSSSSSGGGGASSSSSGGATASSGGSTTTALGDGGDLQGAKLGEKSHKEIESKGDGGPKSTGGQSANEPGRTAKDIQTIVAGRRDEARACYDKALPAHPGIEGDLDIKWVITPEGNVTDASVDTTKSQILEPTVGQCIIDIIKKIKFAASSKGYETRAHYPFNFHPKQFSGKDAGK